MFDCGNIFGIEQYDGESKRLKSEVSNEDNENTYGNSGKAADQPPKPAEQPKQDYIHVRARRGQATDSHSLAERVMTLLYRLWLICKAFVFPGFLGI